MNLDITTCKGEGCKAKESCRRFLTYKEAVVNDADRIWLMSPPYKTEENGEQSCEMYWGENQTNMLEQLEEINKK
jgi:hypothetical protein